MKRLFYIVLLLAVACTQPYLGIDSPNSVGGTSEDINIINYIDQRLSAEYYWLDEVNQKSNAFNRRLQWEDYLDAALGTLTTNADDGYVNSKGQRMFYSYIKEITSSTRADVTGFGIGLHYTIVIVDIDNGYYGFLVEKVYPNSPAEAAGVLRGDVITKIGGARITSSNYYSNFVSIEDNSVAQLKLTLKRQTDAQTYDVTLSKGIYAKTPVLHHEVLDVEDKKIGYLVYTSFDAEYNDNLLSTITELKNEGAEEFILDLRCNGGGSVISAVKLCSALVPESLNGGLLCSVERNKNNSKMEQKSEFYLEDTGQIFSLEHLTVICSGYSASASELVIMGLRGLDFPVTLIGSQTEGKNCGMDVTRKSINGVTVEFAPITFMCFNAKGYGDWGEGITPDIDLTSEGNGMGVVDESYPIPRADWGNTQYDIALAAAVAKITGKSITQATTRVAECEALIPATTITKPSEGIRICVEE